MSNKSPESHAAQSPPFSTVAIIGQSSRAQLLYAQARANTASPLHLSSKLPEPDVLTSTPALVLACSMLELDRVLAQAAPHLSGDQIVFHCICGLSGDGEALQTVSHHILARTCIKKTAVLWGPQMTNRAPSAPKDAEAVSASDALPPSGWTVACAFREGVETARHLFATRRLRLYENNDQQGTEVAAALFPLYALGCGVAYTLGYKPPTVALLLTRSVAEMARLGAVLGADPATFSGLSALGALVCEAVAQNSLWFALGQKLVSNVPTDARDENTDAWDENTDARDENTDELHALQATARAVVRFARRHAIPMPVLFALEAMLCGKKQPLRAAADLLALEVGRERDFSVDPTPLHLPLPSAAPRGGPGKG